MLFQRGEAGSFERWRRPVCGEYNVGRAGIRVGGPSSHVAIGRQDLICPSVSASHFHSTVRKHGTHLSDDDSDHLLTSHEGECLLTVSKEEISNWYSSRKEYTT